MRVNRFLPAFALGALSMLSLVLAAGWVAPGGLHRALLALGVEPSPPGPAIGATAAPAALPRTPDPIGSQSPFPPADAPFDNPADPLPPPAPAPSTSPGSGAGSRLLIPVQGVDAASLVDTYADARGSGRRHDAIDITAPRGTPVLAAGDGRVMKLFQSDLGGTTLYQLAPDNRTIYYYAHLDRYAPGIVEGRLLRRGELLGYVGNTGDAGPGNHHLHFEVSTTLDPQQYWGGVPTNPYPLLR